MASLPQRYRRTVVSNYLTVGVQAIASLVMTPVLTAGLGKTGYGVWALALSLVLYLELLEFGFARTVVRAVAAAEAVGDRDTVRRSITTSVVVLALPGFLALTAGLVLAAFFPSLFDLDPALAGPARAVCAMVAVALAMSIPSDTFGATLMAFQRFDLLNCTLIAVTVAEAIGWFVVLRLGGGLVAIGVVTVVISLCGQLARFLAARHLLGYISLSRQWFDRRLVKPLAGISFWFFLRDMAEVLVHRIDVVVVGLVVGVPEAGVYAVAQKLSLLAERAIWPATVTFLPESALLAATDDRERLRSTVLTGTRIALGLAGPVCLTLAILADPAIGAWVGESFSGAAPVVAYLAAATAVKALTRTGLLALQGMGDARFPALVLSAEAVLNLALSVVLGRRMGLQGVALGTLLAACVTELAVTVPVMCRKLGLPVRSFVATAARAHLPALVIAGAVGAVLRPRVDGVLEVAIGAVAIAGVYLLVFALTGLDAAERRRARDVLARRGPEISSSPGGG